MKRKISQRNEKLLHLLEFFVKFNLFAIPLYIILLSRFEWAWLEQFVVDIVTPMLQFLGLNPTTNGLMISIPIRDGSWAAVINWDCTGWKSMLAFFALVMATNFSLRRKLAGMVLIPVIFIVNLLRIVFMFFYVRTFDLANYQTVHAVVWSWGLIATIIVLWLLWLRFDFTKFWKRKRTRVKRKMAKRSKVKRKGRKR
ncbi:MAG TPA: exosortase/archaeosortase family protein [archaeon]|nr:exosortase/archaeosortase family protein [archaeon]